MQALFYGIGAAIAGWEKLANRDDAFLLTPLPSPWQAAG
jgi:hypothetical protein